MYVPTRFSNKDAGQSLDLIRQYPFATVFTVQGGMPFVSHLPLVLETHGDEMFLLGHLARANPHAKTIGQSDAYVIFHGPHQYITPVWYKENDVPTWNYAVVHITGSCELIEDTKNITECIEKLTNHMESGRSPRWDFWVPEDLQDEALSKHIAGFKIRVKSLQGKFKLSQNRSPEDRDGVMQGLQDQGDEMSLAILEMMKLRK
ncbi:MAG: FMN-binding negative transcriptional regulator [Bdellovibrionales bacterium]|nr:FMN-binding negative transcriptional regulator [Bdellovibrionales bacterium]